MGRFTGVLLVSDFDGTIYGSKTGMPPQNVEAAEEFIKDGGIFAIATGRTYVTFAPQWGTIATNAPTILSNGACIYDFHLDKKLKKHYLPDTAQEDLQKLAQEMPSLAMEIYHAKDIYAYRPNEVTAMHMDIVKGSYTLQDLQDIPHPWLKALIQEEHDVLQEARTRLHAMRPDTYEAIFSNPRYLEVTSKGVNKGYAVKKLAQLRDIAPEHIYCMGDNENDLPMMDVTSLFMAPSSSAKVVLEKNPHLLCSCEEGALAAAVKLLGEKYSS